MATFSFVTLEAVFAFVDGTLFRGIQRGVDGPFCIHGGALFDMVLFPYINVFVWPHLTISRYKWLVLVSIGSFLSIAFHINWYAGHINLNITDWVWPQHSVGHWLKAMSLAGLMHLVFMAIETAIMLAFAWSTTPIHVNLRVGFIMSLLPVFGVAATTTVIVGTPLTLYSITMCITIWIMVWCVVFWKNHRIKNVKEQGQPA